MLPMKREDILVVHREQDGKAYAGDDVSGSELNPELSLKAREEEMEQFKEHGVYEKVKEEVCWAVAGKAPIGTRRVDINKGDGQSRILVTTCCTAGQIQLQ